ncbi:M48 family metallopeptidase [Aureibacter tunicatorum]|uniref:Zn-dependent protease with chaperone function n=1 Tax=Aureibacter tunicatorum TaxID=866807 RepID=A0AAE3XUB0_9BACT|nr:M48 family metallopeptidase [Aureibacter tunicatorum]MDR6241834.1 Zn-dependent protease with chaperone function [Aureibacter tunicatorum]BDD07081.1 hypothetical protein AUTU_45640 [Aureibacter tunicatorum]
MKDFYDAIGLNDKLEPNRYSGNIHVKRNKLVFSTESHLIELPLKDLKINFGGTGNRLIYFSHVDWPDWHFHTSDSDILNDPNLANNDFVQEQVKAIHKTFNIRKSIIYGLPTLAIFLVLSIFLFKGLIIEKVAKSVPFKYEKMLSEHLVDIATYSQEIVKDDSLNHKFDNRIQSLVKHTEEGFQFEFHMVINEEVNAFALPGGTVIINTGLLEHAESWEEVLGVMAHEISHVTERHHIRSMLNQIGIFDLLAIYLGDESLLVNSIFHYADNLETLSYSRDFESEADNNGLNLLLTANINPDGMIQFFNSLGNSEIQSLKILDFLSTHPNSTERSNTLAMSLENHTANKKQDFANQPDYSIFKNILQDYLSSN